MFSLMQMDIRVAIFEDNQLFREAMQAILNGTPGYTCCGAYGDSHQLVAKVERSRPDVILMDIEMPGITGIDATREVRSRFSEVKVLIQTVFNESDKIFQALCAGASGYILKSDQPSRYLEAISEVYNGGAPVSMAIASKVLGFFTNKNVILVSPSNEDYQLTPREKELLSLMIEGHDYKTVAEKTYISYDTVRTHVRHIYKKLHVACRNEAVMKAVQQGLV
ncbi:MAG TPA: response regulator transcription factor [Saprospiraceae bacterium]|jgi:DNA-binding NarL/FixJ family response regulator